MGSYSYYKHTRTESVKLPYSFRCEQCMNDSGPRVVTVTGSAHENSYYKMLSDGKDAKLRRDAHKDLVRTLKNLQKDAVEKQRIDTIFSDECPHCHKHQSWGISGMKREMFTTPIAFFCVGIFFSIIGLIGQKSGDLEYMTTPVILGILAAGAVAALISLIWNIIKINQKTAKMDMSMQKNLPVIGWEAVQHLLNEP